MIRYGSGQASYFRISASKQILNCVKAIGLASN